MRRNIYNIVKHEGVAGILLRLKKKYYYGLWWSIFPNEAIRFEYCLNPKSIVVDVGGYNGDFAARIYEKYECTVRIFEPVQEFADRIEKRFFQNPKIILERYGLAAENKTLAVTKMEDSSSAFRKGEYQEVVQLKKASSVLKGTSIDLMKINIEGGEYELLRDLLDAGIAQNIENIQVQFHEFVKDANNLMVETRKRLEATHYLTYKVDYVWENWKRK